MRPGPGDGTGIERDQDGHSRVRVEGAIRTRSDLQGKAQRRNDRELVEADAPCILAGPHQSGGKLIKEAMTPR